MYKRGFTLVEVMLVIIIIGILAAIVMPRLVGRSEEARIAATKADMSNIALAVNMYEIDTGNPATTLAVLVSTDGKGPYLRKEPVDPWGHAYEYTPASAPGEFFTLCSKGHNETDPADDICYE